MSATRKVRASVDHDVCVGSATCTRTAPGHFKLNARMQSEPMNPEDDDWRRILEAAENCPVSAIRVVDAATGKVLFPGGTR